MYFSLKISLDPEKRKLLKKNKKFNFDLRSLKELLEISKVSISPGSTTLMESVLNGNVVMLLNTNPTSYIKADASEGSYFKSAYNA